MTATETLTKPKTIQGIAFPIRQPYAPGHVLNEAEARVLNQTRSENIGNNVRNALAEAIEANKPQADLDALVAAVDAKYEFNLRTASESRKMDPYEREARNIAKDIVKQHLAAAGRKLTDIPAGLSKDEWDEKLGGEIDKVAGLEKVVAAAKKAVDAKRKSADALMESIGGLDV